MGIAQPEQPGPAELSENAAQQAGGASGCGAERRCASDASVVCGVERSARPARRAARAAGFRPEKRRPRPQQAAGLAETRFGFTEEAVAGKLPPSVSAAMARLGAGRKSVCACAVTLRIAPAPGARSGFARSSTMSYARRPACRTPHRF